MDRLLMRHCYIGPVTFSAQNSRYCLACRKSKKACVCAWITPFDPCGIRTTLWVHPKELDRARSTSWLTHKVVENSNYLVEGADPLPQGSCALLFPSEDAQPWNEVPFEHVVVVDGTWDECRAMIKRSPVLCAMPKVSLRNAYQGHYIARQAPWDGALCTMEALGHLILLDLVESLNQRERSFYANPSHLRRISCKTGNS